MCSTASAGFHSADVSSHILISHRRSFANETKGGSGTSHSEKWINLLFPSLMHLSWLEVDATHVTGCRNCSGGAGACDDVTKEATEQSMVRTSDCDIPSTHNSFHGREGFCKSTGTCGSSSSVDRGGRELCLLCSEDRAIVNPDLC